MTIISKIYSRLLALSLSFLGFSAILSSCVKYGTPGYTTTYKAKGTVISHENDAPIEGIRAVLKAPLEYEDKFRGMDTVFTNSKGVFNLTSHQYETYFDKLYVELTDIDGEKNGLFIDRDVEVDFSHVKFKGKELYRGEVEKDLRIIKMELKK